RKCRRGSVRRSFRTASRPACRHRGPPSRHTARSPRRKRRGGRAMRHVLDRPIWSAHTTRHQALAEGGGLARRYRPSIVPFAATAAADADSLQALARLLAPGETAVLVQADEIVLPPEISAVSTATLV